MNFVGRVRNSGDFVKDSEDYFQRFVTAVRRVENLHTPLYIDSCIRHRGTAIVIKMAIPIIHATGLPRKRLKV